MSLRAKALLSSILALLGLVAVSYGVLQTILPRSYAQLEERETRKDVARASDALAVNLAQLESTTEDWARWDDTRNFVENASQAYIKVNLTESTFTDLGLNLMVFVHSSGRIVFSENYDLQNHKEIPVPPSLQTYLASGSYLTSYSDITSAKTGIVSLPEGPLLVASLPILSSDEQGPIHGTLIFGRFLDAVQIAHLAQTTHLTLAIHRWDDPQLPASFQSARSALSDQTPVVVQPLDEQTVAGYALVKDIFGEPAFILSTESTREIYQQGQVSISCVMWSLIAMGVVFAAIAFVVVERLFLTHMTYLSQDVRQIGAGGDPLRRVLVRGNDELSTLAREINRMLDALQTSEQRYRALFEGAPMIVYALDTAGKITALNPVFEQVTGWTRAEWLGRPFAEIIPPQDLAEMQQVFQRAARGELPNYAERRILSKSGAVLTVELLGVPQTIGGQVVGVTGFARDITERKHAEEALRESEEKYRALVENINEVIYTLDLDGRFTYVSPVAERLSAYKIDDLLGRNFAEFIHPDDLPSLLASFTQTVRGVLTPFEYRIFDKDGAVRYIRTSSRPIMREGVVVGLTGVMTDFTERKRAEEALRESERRYRDLVEHSRVLICTHDLQGNFLSVNQWGSEFVGYDQDTFLRMNLHDIVMPDVRDKVDEYLAQIRRDGFANGLMDVRTRTGEKRIWEFHNTLRTEGVPPPIVRGVAHDVTEQKRLEHALRESEERWRTYIEQANDLIFALDASGRATLANRALCDALGYTETELLGKSAVFFIAPEARAAAQSVLRSIWSGTSVERFEADALTRDQRRLTLEVRGHALRQNGAILGTFHIARDVSERRRAEEALQESNARFHALVEGIPDLVYLKDGQGHNLYINKAYEDFVGCARAGIIGKRDDEILPPSLAEKCWASDAEVLRTAALVRFEEPTIGRDGAPIFFETIKNPVFNQAGHVIGLVGISRDITERKRAEAALQEYSDHLEQMVEARTRELRDAQEQLLLQERLAVLGRLAGSIAHELRSPLGAIKNAAYYLKMCVAHPSADAREMLQILDQQVDVSARIIGSLLDFARPKTPTMQQTNVIEVVEAARARCNIPDNIAVHVHAEEGLPRLMIDAEQMQLVFGNLITNAVQAMPQGGCLDIAAQQRAGTVCVIFSDTGMGIPSDALDKIFQPLYTTKAKGIGLGLALCKMIIEAHGGSIAVTSTVEKGTTFAVSLPLPA